MDLIKLFDAILNEIPDTIEKNGKLYKIKFEEVDENDLIDTAEIISDFDKYLGTLDAEIWNDAFAIFKEKYNSKLFDELLGQTKLTKDKFEQLKNAMTAYKQCVIYAAENQIRYLTNKYLSNNKCLSDDELELCSAPEEA